MALPCSALYLAAFLAVLVHHHRPKFQVDCGRTNLTAGVAMKPPSYITSPSGAFVFGFRALDASNPGKFLLATWFRSQDDNGGQGQASSLFQLQSVVWFAKQSSSVALATDQSVLSVTADGQLALADTTDGGNLVLWRAPVIPSQARGSLLVILDSGNVQFLADGGGRGNVLWESFSYPTDTLLPGQSLAMDAQSDGKLISKRADTEFTAGRFTMGIQTDGNVVLYVDLLSGNSPDNAYWQAYANTPDGNTTVSLDEQGALNYTLHNGTVRSLISPPPMDDTIVKSDKFARMDPDGVVRVYVRSNDATSWIVLGAFPSDGCNKWTSGLQGVCGPGSYCTEHKDRLRCVCPDGYTYIDAQHPDSGCAQGFAQQSCDGESNTGEFTLVDLPNTTWKTSIYYKKFSSVTEDQCRDYCLNDCYCTAALMIDGTDCAEVAALTNGRNGSDVTTKALIKVRRSSNHPAAARASSAARTKTIVAVPVCLAFLLLAVAGGFLAKHYLITKDRESEGLLSVRAFSWKELHQATNGFAKLLGKGSFGEVYQGKLRSPHQPRLIAVKRLINSNEYSEREFTNEVQSIGQIHHRNLVRMIGYCKEGKHRMLVLEFMPGGSLRGFLFKPERPPWSWRAEAALGIARGIEYLHNGCAFPIIHCDIKPDNILLDDTNAPKITDFGISKLLGDQQVHTTVTNIRGTRGYIAPEWFRSEARIDTKADVYSFGVVLLEMICCRKCQDPLFGQDGEETVTLFGWAGQLVSSQRTELILHKDDDAMADLERVERFARVAFWCIEPNPSLRPTMHHVVQMLETAVVEPEVLPNPPACYMNSSPLVLSSV